MATLDGYHPYKVNLTAKQIEEALMRAYKLNDLGEGNAIKVYYTKQTNLTEVSTGDFWFDRDNNFIYIAEKLSTGEVLWFEI